jgi:uncharacterized protein with GYD domain
VLVLGLAEDLDDLPLATPVADAMARNHDRVVRVCTVQRLGHVSSFAGFSGSTLVRLGRLEIGEGPDARLRVIPDARRRGRNAPKEGGMFTYVALIELTPVGHEKLDKTPEYLEKFTRIIEEVGGKLERVLTVMGPWDFLAIVQYPDNETAFKAIAKLGKFDVIKTETFPAEDVELFVKALA